MCIWTAVDVDSKKELPALHASYIGVAQCNYLLKEGTEGGVVGAVIKPMILVDRGLWYRFALYRLGLAYA